MDSPVKGRLRNIDLPFSKGAMPVYEAVINSIQSAEEACEGTKKNLHDFNVDIEILRNPQSELSVDEKIKRKPPIIGFRIVDDGVGFTDDNWNSFKTLDSLKKADKGCRGIGRLLWLKAFDRVLIDSCYLADGKIARRKFTFDVNAEVSEPQMDLVANPTVSTRIELSGFNEKYATAIPNNVEKFALGLLEHCLWYFVRKQGVPTITIHDDGEEPIDLFSLFDEYMHTSASTSSFEIKGNVFEVTHVKVRAARKQNHILGYCAAGRLVKEESLKGKIPGLFSTISDDVGDFVYTAYLTSKYLDEKVRGQRTGFHIDETADALFADSIVSFDDIRRELLPKIQHFLGDSLNDNLEQSRIKLETFVSEVAPKYRPLLGHIPEDRLEIDPSISDRDLDMLLHRETYQIEQNLLSDGHDLMEPRQAESYEGYHKRLEGYLQKAADMKKSDLASYVMHRRIIIDLLSGATKSKLDEKFEREDFIHDLIVPMRKTSDDIEFRRQNLWLLDERLAFHDFLASDKPLGGNPTTSSISPKKPDISSLKVYGNPLLVGEQTQQQASITVVEIKRPMRKDFKPGESEEKDPILQALGYLRRLREGSATRSGRPIPNADRIPGFVYVLADFTDHLLDCCKLHQLQKTADGLGFFGYHRDESYNAYIQVLSFDGLVVSATERNRAFFDQLGLPSKTI